MQGKEEDEAGSGIDPEDIEVCSICSSNFDPQAEGGIVGFFGILPVQFCLWCYNAMCDMVQQNCLHCCEDEDPVDPPASLN